MVMRKVVVKKRKLNQELIAKAKRLSELDLTLISLKQERLLKERAAFYGRNPLAVEEFDEWE